MPWTDHIREHLDELRTRILRSVIVIVAIMACLMMFHAEEIQVGEFVLYYPTPDLLNNIASQVIGFMRDVHVPEDVPLIQTAPGQVFFAQMHVAGLLGIMVGMPVIVREAMMFLRPALEERERRIGRIIIVPAVALFVTGATFAFVVVIPYMLDFLYRFGEAAGIVTFLNVTDFVKIVIEFLIAFGFSFQLPLFMYAISAAGIVDSRYWLRNAHMAVVVIVVFGALITPDGSGVTMWFIALPMIALYFAGVAAIRRSEPAA